MATPSHPLSSAPILPGEGEERVVRILESITDAFCAFDREWDFTFLNEAARRLFAPYVGDPEKLLGQCYWEVFPETLGTNLEKEFRRAVDAGIDVDFEYFHAPWAHWYVLRGYPIQGGGLSVYFRDVTDEKMTEQALVASEEKYRSLFNAIDEGFCIVEMLWDEKGRAHDYRFVDANGAFAGQTGLTNAVGKTARELVPGLEEHWFETYGGVARSGKAIRFVQGSEPMERWFDVYAFPLGNDRVAIRCTDISEKRRAETEMARLDLENRSRLAELETLLQVMPIGIGIALDNQCEKIRVNAAFAHVLGIRQEDNASKTAPEEERPENFKIIDDTGREVPGRELPLQVAAREGKTIRDRELNIVHADGRWIRLLEYAAPLFDEQGQPRGSVGAFVDITERMLAEVRQQFLVKMDDAVRPLSNAAEIVATSARLLGEHMNADRCAYAEIESDEDSMHIMGDYTRDVPSIVGRFTFSQFGAEALRCMREDEAYVVEDIEIHPLAPEDLSAYQATQIRAVICVPLKKDGVLMAAMAVHQKAVRRWTETEVSLVRHVANRCWEALQRAKITRELMESEARFRQIADVTPQVVWLARADGYVEYFNRRWYDYTGLPEDGDGHTGWIAALHPDDVDVCRERWYHSVNTGEPYEIRYRWRDCRTGKYRWFLGRALPLRDEHGEIVRWYGTSTDIDDLIRAEETARLARSEAERANRAKDEFLATLSHELRTPLTPVLMAAEALSADTQLDAETRETLSMIQRNIALEARLIDDLLDLTRISHGKLALRLQTADAHSLLALALEIVREEAQAKGLLLVIDYQAQNTSLQCDPSRIQQVFWNLLKNAVKFTPAQGLIHIRSRDEGSQFLAEVSDSGIGIAREKLERIFLPFEQAGLANDHRFGGLGLGLSISKSLVHMHGGTIQAVSEGPGQGATFQVLLPASPSTDSTAATHGTPSPVQATAPLPVAGMRLLLVEDHEPTLVVLSRLLRRAGHEVTTAANVASALEAAAAQRFDGVISDVGLPDGTGLELMRVLKDLYGLRGIALTGYGMEEDINRAHQSGFVVHLTKPVQFSQLRQALVQLAQVTTLGE